MSSNRKMNELMSTENMDAEICDTGLLVPTASCSDEQCCSSQLVVCTASAMAPKRDWTYPSVSGAILKDARLLEHFIDLEDVATAAYCNCNYFVARGSNPPRQSDFGTNERAETVKWMTEVCEAETLELEVLVLAVAILDRFLAEQTIYRNQLQTLAAASLLIAGKLKLPQPMTARCLSEYTAGSDSISALISWEFLILQRLKWDVSIPTTVDLVEAILGRFELTVNIEMSLRLNSHRFIPRLLLEYGLASLPASLQASICVVAAAYQSVTDERPSDFSFVVAVQNAIGQLMDVAQPQVLSEYAAVLLEACGQPIDASSSRQSQNNTSSSNSNTSPAVLSSIENLMADDKYQFQSPTTTPTDVQDVLVR